jgi:hypothetical protein
MREAMAEASAMVLGGFRLDTDIKAKIVWPERYFESNSTREMWETVMQLLQDI